MAPLFQNAYAPNRKVADAVEPDFPKGKRIYVRNTPLSLKSTSPAGAVPVEPDPATVTDILANCPLEKLAGVMLSVVVVGVRGVIGATLIVVR